MNYLNKNYQSRELTIHTLRNELQETELLIQQTEEQYQEQINQFKEQIKEKDSNLILIEQDYRKIKPRINHEYRRFY